MKSRLEAAAAPGEQYRETGVGGGAGTGGGAFLLSIKEVPLSNKGKESQVPRKDCGKHRVCTLKGILNIFESQRKKFSPSHYFFAVWVIESGFIVTY
jgi:hypothetical protein